MKEKEETVPALHMRENIKLRVRKGNKISKKKRTLGRT